MNREIKFRAWDKAHKKMSYKVNLYSINRTGVINKVQIDNKQFMNDVGFNCELMQFTGLHDRNRKEIYEGDILQFETKKEFGFQQDGRRIILPPVEFGEFNPRENILYTFIGFHIAGSSIQYRLGFGCEIIGNIYENPELLK